jgi:hypothetical protein
MEVQSVKTHSVLAPFGFVLTTLLWRTFGTGFVQVLNATPIATRTLAEDLFPAK